jgi:hypothetical protein
MARTDLTKTTAEGAYGDYAAGDADVTMAAADTVDKNAFTFEGKDLIIAHNTGASAHTVTVTSAPDPYGRSQDIDGYSIGAGEIAAFGPLEADGWLQSDGKIYLEADNAEVEFGVVKLPG